MRKMLFKVLIVTCFILVTFFSVNNKISAASFNYADFNWEEFLEQNKQHWITSCDEGDEKCYDRILKTQEKFYKRLYKLLTKFQRKGFLLDDNVIIATVFYGISPNTFEQAFLGENPSYKLDFEDEEEYLAEVAEASFELAKEYFAEETDSLKTLMNNMIGYTQTCYGVTNVTQTTDSYGNINCGQYMPYQDKCVEKVEVFETTFFNSIGLVKANNESKCTELTSEYSSHILGGVTSDKGVNLELYWKFLTESDYFDTKKHLQNYFEHILGQTGHRFMSELSSDEYEEHEEEIKKCRERIIKGIQSVIKTNEIMASKVSMMSGRNSSYWWPIGSSETTDNGGVIMAIGEPESVNISSQYGLRVDPVTGATNSMHNGVDITGSEGVTNIIAARNGTVISVIDDNGGNCTNGDSSCGGGYGNFIIIQHVDNNYTVYAHLAPGTITVKNGDVVTQGQVIAKMGTTGKSTGAHLHFEVRVGGNDTASTQDPLLFIDADNPRSVGIEGELLEWIGVMEGTGPMEGDNYVVYADSGGIATFGHGITVINNKDLIYSFGINPNSLTVGSLVPKSVADEMYAKLVPEKLDNIKSVISSRGLNFSENQLAALVSLQYNAGSINDFFEPFSKYGATEDLCSNWWENYALYDNKRQYQPGLKSRRIVECDAFVNGVYNMNPYG